MGFLVEEDWMGESNNCNVRSYHLHQWCRSDMKENTTVGEDADKHQCEQKAPANLE